MNKTARVILAVLALAVAFSMVSCNLLELPENVPGKTAEPGNTAEPGATEIPEITDAPAPTEEPQPADLLIGTWKSDEEGIELIFDRDGAGYGKRNGEIYIFQWTRDSDTVSISFEGESSDMKIARLEENEVDFIPILEGQESPDDQVTMVRKPARAAADVTREQLIGRWEMEIPDYGKIMLQLNADGYAEESDQYDIGLFQWTLTGDELRLMVEGEAYGFYFSVSAEDGKLTRDNETGEPEVLERSAEAPRVPAEIDKSKMTGSWETDDEGDVISLVLNADGTGETASYGETSALKWYMHDDVIVLTMTEEGYTFFYYVSQEGGTLTLYSGLEEFVFAHAK